MGAISAASAKNREPSLVSFLLRWAPAGATYERSSVLSLPQEQAQLNQMRPTWSVRDLRRPIRGCALFPRNRWLYATG
jgi:hypothetical protein